MRIEPWRIVGCVVSCLLMAGVPVRSATPSPALAMGAASVAASGNGELPPPLGIGITFYGQSQDYKLAQLSFSVPGFSVDPSSLAIANRLSEANVKIDYWVLPFLNVFGLAGQLDGKTTVDFRRAQLPIQLDNLVIDYDGNVFGGGITLAAGNQRWFGSLTAIYTKTDLSGDFDSKVKALVIAPKFGLHDGRGALWVGAMYQDAQEDHSGRITLPIVGGTDFAVRLNEKDSVNLQVGMSVALTEHWFLEVEGGTLGRESGSMAITYRF